MKLKIIALTGLLAINALAEDIAKLRVHGNSMYPTFKNGDLLYIDKDIPYSSLREGDIVCFNDPEYSQEISTCHRVVLQTFKGFIAKGDNNFLCDGNYIIQQNYVGKVVKVISE